VHSDLRIELEDPQRLVASAGLRDACGPRDRRPARQQFEHREPAVESKKIWAFESQLTEIERLKAQRPALLRKP
jgi:hypothetical protein